MLGQTNPSLLAFGALAVQRSNGAILDPAPASFGAGESGQLMSKHGALHAGIEVVAN